MKYLNSRIKLATDLQKVSDDFLLPVNTFSKSVVENQGHITSALSRFREIRKDVCVSKVGVSVYCVCQSCLKAKLSTKKVKYAYSRVFIAEKLGIAIAKLSELNFCDYIAIDAQNKFVEIYELFNDVVFCTAIKA